MRGFCLVGVCLVRVVRVCLVRVVGVDPTRLVGVDPRMCGPLLPADRYGSEKKRGGGVG